MFTWLKHPSILGYDVAGEVVEVGKDVTRFQVGDRVIGFAVGTDEKVNDPAEGAFQEYMVLRPDLTSPIPNSLSYEAISVTPLGLSIVAAGLFQEDTLALHLPCLSPKPTGQTLIVWGGSTSVGCNAIQLGVAAGYEVFTTCSPSNSTLSKDSVRARFSTTEARALFPI
jgi:NADPH:quinone reductase-like Zn-dependent oxidoreductase